MLEAYWETRKKDMLDLIVPFVQYGVATTTAVGETINTLTVTDLMRNEFGYTDIPESVVIKVINRDRDHFSRNNRKYYLKSTLDSEVERLSHRKNECLSKIDAIGDELYEFLQMHCKRTKIKSKEQCVDFLQEFFSAFALQVGLESLEQESISHKNDEVNYYISRYIFSKKNEKSIEYETILDLTKGYLLRAAIYLQIDNPNIDTASYKNISIYYDTPFLIQLLGYQSEKEAESASALHNCLRRLGARFYYFPQNEEELNNILYAYQYSLVNKQSSSRTLEGLDLQGYGFGDVDRIRKTFPSILSDEYDIHPGEIPSYAKTNSGSIDIEDVDISERDAIDYVRRETRHYTDENLMSDVTSAIGIHKLRHGEFSQSIEKCIALFVTTNIDFTRAFNKFYKENVRSNVVMPVITAFNLSAIAWVKGGIINSEIPERQLLTNAYLASQPAPEIMERCRTVLNQLENEGKITAEDAISLRADRVTQRELWIDYFPTWENIDEKYIEKLQEKQRKRLIGEAENELADRYRQKTIEDEKQRFRGAQKNAGDYARKKKMKYIIALKTTITIVLCIVAVGGCIGLIKSIESIEASLCSIIFIVLSGLSIVDTLAVRSRVIGKWIEKRANHYETKIYEKKMEEYKTLL